MLEAQQGAGEPDLGSLPVVLHLGTLQGGLDGLWGFMYLSPALCAPGFCQVPGRNFYFVNRACLTYFLGRGKLF